MDRLSSLPMMRARQHLFAIGPVVLACSLLGMVGSPSAGQTEISKGRQMVDGSIKALGGDRFLNLHTRTASGRVYSFFRDRLSGHDLAKIYVRYGGTDSAKSLALQEREFFGKKLDYSNLYMPDRAWELTFRGARQIPDENWQKYLRTTRNDVLYILRCRLGEPGLQFEYIGADVYLGMHVEVLEITDAGNQTVRVLLDHNTMLPIHESFQWLDEVTRERNDEVTEYGKWRDAGGVQWPYSIERQRNGYKVYQIFADKVEVDQEIPPATFELPAKSKVLH